MNIITLVFSILLNYIERSLVSTKSTNFVVKMGPNSQNNLFSTKLNRFSPVLLL